MNKDFHHVLLIKFDAALSSGVGIGECTLGAHVVVGAIDSSVVSKDVFEPILGTVVGVPFFVELGATLTVVLGKVLGVALGLVVGALVDVVSLQIGRNERRISRFPRVANKSSIRPSKQETPPRLEINR
jgi:hypothetical protein